MPTSDPYSVSRILRFYDLLITSSPPKIKGIRIIDNPFPDIIPRITAAERRAQQRAREEALKEREEYERRKNAKKRELFHNFIVMITNFTFVSYNRDVKLLSFGVDEGDEEEAIAFKKKPIVRPDCRLTFVISLILSLIFPIQWLTNRLLRPSAEYSLILSPKDLEQPQIT